MARFTITATLDGFPVAIEAEGRADQLRALVDRLKAIGAEPPVAPVAASEPAKQAAPTCPTHGTPMKASRKPGTFFCSKRLADGDYCPEKA